jgi:hypothetical protein
MVHESCVDRVESTTTATATTIDATATSATTAPCVVYNIDNDETVLFQLLSDEEMKRQKYSADDEDDMVGMTHSPLTMFDDNDNNTDDDSNNVKDSSNNDNDNDNNNEDKENTVKYNYRYTSSRTS